MRTYEELSTTEKIREWIARMSFAVHISESACAGLPHNEEFETRCRKYDQAKAEQYVCENNIDKLLTQLDTENRNATNPA